MTSVFTFNLSTFSKVCIANISSRSGSYFYYINGVFGEGEFLILLSVIHQSFPLTLLFLCALLIISFPTTKI